MNHTAVDSVKIKNGLIIGVLMVLSVFLGYYSVKTGFLAIGFLIPAIGLASWMFGRPATLLVFVMFLSVTRFTLPQFANALSLSNLYLAVLIGWALLDAALRSDKRSFSYSMNIDFWLIIFSINLMLVISVRGFGMAIFGGTTFGGAAYIALFLAILAYFSMVRIRLYEKHVRYIIWGVLAGSAIPMIVEVCIYFFEGQAWWLRAYFDLGAVGNLLMEKFKQSGGIERWESFGGFAFSIIPVAYILCKKKGVRFVLIALVFLLIGMTGFRNRIVRAGMLIFVFSMYFSRDRGKTFLFWIGMGLLGFVILLLVSGHLPLVMQRSVSFLPFIEVDEVVSNRAANSSNWRFDLWLNYCLPNVPRYLLVGKGLAQDYTQYAWLDESWYHTGEFFYYTGAYHSGPFSLLLDYGLLGTISFSAFFILHVLDGWKTIQRFNLRTDESLIARYYIYLTVLMTYEMFGFYFIFGDVDTMMLRLIFIVVQMRVLKKNFILGKVLDEPAPAVPITETEIQLSGAGLNETKMIRL